MCSYIRNLGKMPPIFQDKFEASLSLVFIAIIEKIDF